MFKGLLVFALVTVVISDGQVPCQIPGPRNKSHNVAIVGAGSAGIHMALRLKQKGFQNVVVYDKNGVVGGDDYRASHRGTTFSFPARVGRFNTILKSLMDTYAASDLIQMAPATTWSKVKDANANLQEMSGLQYVFEAGKKYLNTNNETAVKITIINTLYSYINAYNSIFNVGSSCSFFNEPQWGASKFNSEGTFRNFLDRYNLRLLDGLFEKTTIMGKGYLDQIPATYGLFIFNPTMINGLVAVVNGTAPADSVDYIIRNGEQTLWQAIASREGLNVQLSTMVDRLRRDSLTETTNVHLRIQPIGGTQEWKTYQFVIWTANMKSAVKKYWSWKRPELNAGPSHEEYQNFLRINDAGYRSIYLFDSELMERGGSYIDEFPDDAKDKTNGIYQMFDTYAIHNVQTNTNLYRNRAFPSENADGSEFRTVMAVNYFTSAQSQFTAQNYFSKVQNLFNPVNVSFVSQMTESYNPKFSASDMTNGMIWRILAMQGKYGLWYAGGSVYDSSTPMILRYNEILLAKMKPAVEGLPNPNTSNK